MLCNYQKFLLKIFKKNKMMKTFILSIGMFVLASVAFAQNCLRIVQPTLFSGPAANSTYTLTINFQTNGNKSLQTTIFCGSTVIFSDCFSTQGPGTKIYPNLVCSGGLATLSARFITKTGSCNASSCDTTFLGAQGGPLPIKLNTFTAVRSKQNVTLNWSTELEIDSKEFVIERGDGNSFNGVAVVSAVGNSNTRQNYSYNDNNSISGTTYYRLKNIDNNGRFTYSDIRTVKGTGTGIDVTVFPNPARANSRVSIVGVASNSSIQLVDFSGKVLKTISNTTINSLDLTGIQVGSYILKVLDRATNEVVNKKLTVTN